MPIELGPTPAALPVIPAVIPGGGPFGAGIGSRTVARRTKRGLDLAVSALALVLLWPLILLVAALVRGSDGGAALQGTALVGRDGRRFVRLRFRCSGGPRLDGLGCALRRSGFEELPQLWNVLRGEMSLVGPRPLSPPEAECYGAALAACCSMPPGLTAPWWLAPPGASHPERVAQDLAYARGWGVSRDVGIMLRTASAALVRPRVVPG